MKVGTREYEFASQVPWLMETDIVQERTRSRLENESDVPVELVDVDWVEHEISAAEIVGEAASMVYPEKNEGLLAIGEHESTWHKDLKKRSKLAAKAHGLISLTSDRHWRQSRMKRFIRLTAKELYRMVRYFSDKVSTPSE